MRVALWGLQASHDAHRDDKGGCYGSQPTVNGDNTSLFQQGMLCRIYNSKKETSMPDFNNLKDHPMFQFSKDL